MTDAGGHAATAPHRSDDHGAGHGSPDAHGVSSGEEALGPIDVQAWLSGILGVGIALLMAACFVLATEGAGAF